MVPLAEDLLDEGKFGDLETMRLLMQVVQADFQGELIDVDVATFVLIHVVHQLTRLILGEDHSQVHSDTFKDLLAVKRAALVFIKLLEQPLRVLTLLR